MKTLLHTHEETAHTKNILKGQLFLLRFVVFFAMLLNTVTNLKVLLCSRSAWNINMTAFINIKIFKKDSNYEFLPTEILFRS